MFQMTPLPEPEGCCNSPANRKRKKNKIDDGFRSELADGACFEGYMGIPSLMDLRNTEIPSRLIPFGKVKSEIAKDSTRGYVDFYMFDDKFTGIITDTDDYIDDLLQFDGVLTPDCTLLTGQSNCLQATSTFLNRAVGYYLQKKGIPVIPQIRWSDKSSYDYCFLGVPKGGIVAVSAYGAIRGKRRKQDFRSGLLEMINVLSPTDILVHGAMPQSVFKGVDELTRIHHYDDWTTLEHKEGGNCNGTRL